MFLRFVEPDSEEMLIDHIALVGLDAEEGSGSVLEYLHRFETGDGGMPSDLIVTQLKNSTEVVGVYGAEVIEVFDAEVAGVFDTEMVEVYGAEVDPKWEHSVADIAG